MSPQAAARRVAGGALRHAWARLPQRATERGPFLALGRLIYRRYTRHWDRHQSHSTWFVRNVPQLEVIRDLLAGEPVADRPLRVTSIGCSTGAELYSVLWFLRTVDPTRRINATGVDISAEVVETARRGLYRPEVSGATGAMYSPGMPELRGLPADTLRGLFTRQKGFFRIKDQIREGALWFVADAREAALNERLDRQDLALANNFLGPMSDREAESGLRAVAAIIRPGGYLVVDGVDLDVKTRVVKSLKLKPVLARLPSVWSADPTKTGWPWTRWSHEPIDEGHRDWPIRYCTIFRVPEPA